ncbi:MAG: hypothetical protein HRT36_00155 [Alphaproteobacteria bacterium]|nr:hypothetical protein [Alphaproteobacteria bacterium]
MLDLSQFTQLECIELDALCEQTLNPTTALAKLDNMVSNHIGIVPRVSQSNQQSMA